MHVGVWLMLYTPCFAFVICQCSRMYLIDLNGCLECVALNKKENKKRIYIPTYIFSPNTSWAVPRPDPPLS